MRQKRRGNFDFFSSCSHFVPGVADLFIILALFLAGSLLGSLASAAFMKLFSGADAEYGMLVAYPISFIPLLIYACVKSRSNSYNSVGFKLDSANFGGRGGALCALVAVVGTFCIAYLSDALTTLLPQMPDFLKDALDSLTGGIFWADFLCAAILAPVLEEWMCRGLVLRGLLNNRRRDGSTMKPVWAIVWSAFFFAVVHMNPWQAIPAFLVGCLFGYVYYKTGSLKLTMLMHFFNNGLAVVLSHIDGLEEMETWADVLPEREYWLVFVCCVIAMVLAVLFFKNVKPLRPQGSCDEVPALFDQI